MKELLELIAKSLVDQPDEVHVTEIVDAKTDADAADDARVDADTDDQEAGARWPTTLYELRVSPDDLGKVIGRQGKTARSVRSILSAAGSKEDRRIVLEIIES
ncbi:MAG: KH domain-containing protein [Acidobacteriota bacterium]|nr:KH domain-containing protein [Acidobacteriota bacterium]